MSSAQRRTQLLKVAGRLFAEEGFHPVSMDAVAAAAGISKPVVYQHFASKRELYQALVQEAADELLRRLSTALETTKNNQERITESIDAFFVFVDDPRFRLLYLTADSADRDVAALLETSHSRVAETVASLIRTDAGLDHVPAMLLATGVRGLAIAGAQWWVDHDDMPRDDAVELLSRLAWRGLRGFKNQ